MLIVGAMLRFAKVKKKKINKKEGKKKERIKL